MNDILTYYRIPVHRILTLISNHAMPGNAIKQYNSAANTGTTGASNSHVSSLTAQSSTVTFIFTVSHLLILCNFNQSYIANSL